LRLLLDENVGTTIALALRGAGHDILRMVDVERSAGDEDVIRRGRADDRVIVTYDSDYGEHVFFKGERPPPAIIYLRLGPDDLDGAIERLVPLCDDATLYGHLVVVDYGNIRRRPFSLTSI
jgi:predicted nuclease of predicted toxin-antitoxin system